MNFLLLSLIIVCSSIQNVAKKSYNLRVSGGVYSFAAGSALPTVPSQFTRRKNTWQEVPENEI